MNHNIQIATFTLCMLGFGFAGLLPDYLPALNNTSTILFRVIVLLLSVWTLLLNYQSKIIRYNISGWALFIFLVYSIRLYNDFVSTNYVFEKPLFESFVFFYGVMVIPFFAASTICNYSILFRIGIFMNWTAFFLVVLCLIKFIINPQFETRFSGSEILNPISMGHYGVTLILLCFVNRKLTNLISISQIFLGFSLVILSASRGPVVSLILCLVLYAWSIGLFRTSKLLNLIILISVLSTMFILVFKSELLIAKRSAETFEDNFNFEERRVEVWSHSFTQIMENPLFGKHTTTDEGYSHNLFLDIFLFGGLMTFAVFFYLLIKVISSSKNIFRITPELAWIPIIALQFFVGSMFSGSFHSNIEFWYMVGAIVACNNIINNLVQDRIKSFKELSFQ